ncbi:MAG: DnaJ domain-containing protein [Treponema sp.]|nr:DnaJ domain-containing protein [Treponema sp.]
MKMEDYYRILGIEKTASSDDIKKAYRKLAFKYHPDRNEGNPQAEEMFKKINEAYSVLGDEQKRAQYDSPFFNAQNTFTGGQSSQSQWNFYSTGTKRSSDPFEEFFNFGQNEYRQHRNYNRRRPSKRSVRTILVQSILQCIGSLAGFFFLGRFFLFAHLIFTIIFIQGASNIFSCLAYLLNRKK